MRPDPRSAGRLAHSKAGTQTAGQLLLTTGTVESERCEDVRAGTNWYLEQREQIFILIFELIPLANERRHQQLNELLIEGGGGVRGGD